MMKYILLPALLLIFLLSKSDTLVGDNYQTTPILIAGKPGIMNVYKAGINSVRITLISKGHKGPLPSEPVLAHKYSSPDLILSITQLKQQVRKKSGSLEVLVKGDPLSVTVKNRKGKIIQELVFNKDNSLSFLLDNEPVLGLGEGGPLPDDPLKWKEQKVQFDRNGSFDPMEPRYQTGIYGQRNPAALLAGTSGWALYIAAPWVSIDMRSKKHGLVTPWIPPDTIKRKQDFSNQKLNLVKGRHPFNEIVPGLYDIFVFDASSPETFMKELSVVTGPAAMPPLWAMGFMQSHRTLQDEKQMLAVVDTFRVKKIPIDAVIYLGTGFCPRGWNTKQPSLTFNPEVFFREPRDVISDLHKRNVKVNLHIVPWDRDRLPGLTGSIPYEPGEEINASHIAEYWKQHQPLIDAGVDGFWPDEGDWFDLHERVKRYQLYYQGMLFSKPGIRPWSLLRNGHPGVAQWGGWLWSGDPHSSWRTLEAQIASGINTSLSITPFWGSDIGGFIPTEELTGELYARWFQFGAFCPSFRAHGRNWWLRLPWGWGQNDMGPVENNVRPPASELNNPIIEKICRKYSELRYQLLSYNYTLAWEASDKGMPMMRAMWLQYPDDPVARGLGDQYMWGSSFLVAPVYEKGAAERKLYLPEGLWYDWWNNSVTTGGKEIIRKVDLEVLPLFVRAGSIIPVDPVRQYTSQETDEIINIRIFSGSDGSYSLYKDDGFSTGYLNGEYHIVNFRWEDRNRILVISEEMSDRSTNSGYPVQFKISILPEKTERAVIFEGKKLKIMF